MRRLALAPLALSLLAACGEQAAPTPQPSGPDATPSAAPLTQAGDLVASAQRFAGEYRVAGVGGAEIDLPHAITASVSADRIHLTAECISVAWAYHFEEGVFATERVPTESCARGLAASEEAVVAAFDGADKVTHMPSGAFEVTGRGPSATLFTQ